MELSGNISLVEQGEQMEDPYHFNDFQYLMPWRRREHKPTTIIDFFRPGSENYSLRSTGILNLSGSISSVMPSTVIKPIPLHSGSVPMKLPNMNSAYYTSSSSFTAK